MLFTFELIFIHQNPQWEIWLRVPAVLYCCTRFKSIRLLRKITQHNSHVQRSLSATTLLLGICKHRSTASLNRSLMYPETPCRIISCGPGTGYAATGVPRLIASIITIPNVSTLLGNANTSALAYQSAKSDPVLYPTN